MGRVTAWLSVYRILAAAEHFIRGYRVEHLQMGLQMGVAVAISLLPVVVTKIYNLSVTDEPRTMDLVLPSQGGAAIWCIIVVVVILEPVQGGALRKVVLRLLGAGASSALGVAILELAKAVVGNDFNYQTNSVGIGHTIVICMSIVLALMAMHKQRWPQYSHVFVLSMMALPIVVAPAIRSAAGLDLNAAGRRILAVVSGVLVSAFTSFFIFPIRARTLLEKKMARTLIKIGDLSVWLLGQVTLLPGKGGGLPGASNTDTAMDYCDDGLSARLCPLRRTVDELSDDITAMRELLKPAQAEWYWFTRPRRFPMAQYTLLLRSCQTVLGLWGSLVYVLESGRFSLITCQQHVSELAELGVQMSASYQAVSTLVRKPKQKKKAKKAKKAEVAGYKHRRGRRWPWLRPGDADSDDLEEPAAVHLEQETLSKAVSVEVLEDSDAQAAGSSASASSSAAQAVAAGAGRVSVGGSEGEPSWQALPDEVDDPFAELAEAQQQEGQQQQQQQHEEGAASLVKLNSLEMESIRLRLRALSRKLPSQAPGSEEEPTADNTAAAAAAAAAAAPGETVAGSAAPAPKAVDGAKASGAAARRLGLTASCSSRQEDEQRVLGKLQQLADAQYRLAEALNRERDQRPSGDDIESFAMVVTTAMGVCRQCFSCFTAVAPNRAEQLHAYVMQMAGPGLPAGC